MSETSFCKNCKRDVPAGSFTLHALHCERFMQICSKCKEPVHKEQMQSHENEVHSLISCKDCRQQIEKGIHNEHIKNDCPRRLIPCEFCEIQCVAAEIEAHTIPCGSRTEKCDICGNHILVRMLKAHEELHKGTKDLKGKTQIPISSNKQNDLVRQMEKTANMDYNMMDSHSQPRKEPEFLKFRNVVCQNILQASAAIPTAQYNENQRTSQKNVNVTGKTNKTSTYHFGKDDEDPLYIPCEFCGEPCSIEMLGEHQMLCNSKVETCPRCGENVYGQLSSHTCSRRGLPAVTSAVEEEYWSQYPTVDNTISDDEASIPCENCGSLFPISCLELHEVACKFSEVSTRDTTANETKLTNIQRETKHLLVEDENDYWNHYGNHYPTDSSNIDENMDDNEASVPCESCGELFPISCLKLHEVACKFGEEHVDHKGARAKDTGNSSKPSLRDAVRQPLDELLPCSFCNISIPSTILEMHEAGCSQYSTQNRTPAVVPKQRPKNTVIKNTRPESASQRALRESTLSATENRLPTTPKIQPSQYVVVDLPDGQQILKKRNPSSNANDPYVGHVLGHGLPYESINNDPSVHFVPTLPKAEYFDRRIHADDHVQNTKVPMKPTGERGVEKRITKKPNASFANYAYQPDPGHRLGREGNPTTPHAFNGAIPRTRFRPDNGPMTRQLNQWDGTTQEFHNARDRNSEASAGVRPKRPPQSRNNF